VIGAVIGWCARHRWLVVFAYVVLAVFAFKCARETPVDAIPDLSDPQVIVFTEYRGQSPTTVEDQVTYPIASRLLAAPKVSAVRGWSMLGMSFVYVVFESGTDPYWARSRVLEYLSALPGRLPQGVTPTLGPDASGVGWIYEYALVDRSGRLDLGELRAPSSTGAAGSISGSSARCRTSPSATRSRVSRASPRSPPSAGTSASTRSRAIRRSCGRSGSPSKTSPTPSGALWERAADACSR
jgi:hypothetical protein